MGVIAIYTHIEDYINELYKALSIDKPEQLEINNIATKLGINVYYSKASFRVGNNLVIQRSTKEREWQLFGHEVCHFLRHYGNQLKMYQSFMELQEWQANYFAYHFCIPTFMLDDLYNFNAIDITRLFNVEFDFALRRLEMYQSKIIGGYDYEGARS